MKVIFSIALEGVHNYGIMCHCYRFQGIFNNVEQIMQIDWQCVRYANLKDMVYSLALYSAMLILGFDSVKCQPSVLRMYQVSHPDSLCGSYVYYNYHDLKDILSASLLNTA